MRKGVAKPATQTMPAVLLNRSGQAVVVGDGAAVEEIDAADARIRRGARQRSESKLAGACEGVQVIVVVQLIVPFVADIVEGNNGIGGERVLKFHVPLQIFWIGEATAHVVKGWCRGTGGG